jgi:hypothetical protein
MRFVKRTTRRKLACIKHITTCMLHAITVWLVLETFAALGRQTGVGCLSRILAGHPEMGNGRHRNPSESRSSGKTLGSPENGKQAFFFVKIGFTFAT